MSPLRSEVWFCKHCLQMWMLAALGAAFPFCCCGCRQPLPISYYLLHPTCLPVVEMGHVHHQKFCRPPSLSGFSCSWLVQLWEEREMFLSPLVQRPTSWTFPMDDWLLGYLPLQRKIPPTHQIVVWFYSPHKILRGDPHVMHFPASHLASSRITLNPHSEMGTTCSLL